MNDTTEERIRQIASLIEAVNDDPTAGQRLADACLAFGLGNGGRLNMAALALVERVTELDDGAVTELSSVTAAEVARRARAM